MEEIIMTHTQLTQLVQALLDAPQSNPKVKEFAQFWLDAEGTEKQAELTKQLVSVAEQNIALIDETIGFAGSELAVQILGEEGLLTYYNTLNPLKHKVQNSVIALVA